MQNFIKKYPEFCAVCLLTLLCLFFLFFGLDFYPILDDSEALFASVAKNILVHDDFKLLVLNMQPFLDKPPLYFWLIAQSINLFDTFNELSVRLPNTIISFIFVFCIYFMGKNVLSRKFGLVSAIILLTNLAYLILSHVALFDITFSFFITFAVYFAFLANLEDDLSKRKKYYWWIFYFLCGLACLVKGAVGIILPFVIVATYYFLIRKLMDVFKPLHIIVGLLIFAPIALPWFYEMSILFGKEFIRNYIYIPNFTSFFKNLVYYALLFIPAFMPWIVIFYGDLFDVVNKIIVRFKNNTHFSIITVEQKVSLFSLVYFAITYLTICMISTSPFAILLLVPSASMLTAYLLCSSDVNEFYKKKVVSFSTYIVAILFTVSTISFAFLYMFLPLNLFEQVQQFKNFLVIGINFLSILLLLKLKNKDVLAMISSYVFSMFFIIVFTVVHGFNMFYFSGENELVEYAKFAKSKDTKLIVYNLPVKPSILMESSDKVYFIDKKQILDMVDVLNLEKNKICYIILKNKDVSDTLQKLPMQIYLLDSGDKYSIYSNIELPKKAISLSKFYNKN